MRAALRRLVEVVRAHGGDQCPAEQAEEVEAAGRSIEAAWSRESSTVRTAARLRLHVPPSGFGRHEVQRLLVMFANVAQYRPVPLAFKLAFEGPLPQQK